MSIVDGMLHADKAITDLNWTIARLRVQAENTKGLLGSIPLVDNLEFLAGSLERSSLRLVEALGEIQEGYLDEGKKSQEGVNEYMVAVLGAALGMGNH